ncbi:MAG: MmgE/PrpD family protein [Kiloniellales bacterium]|nr:MmgE/PrpD family protein [Kiloniellales bacterium]
MTGAPGSVSSAARPSASDAPPDRTAALARDVLDLTCDRLSEPDLAQLKRLVFDHLAVCRRGAEAAWSRAVQDYVRALESGGAAPVFGAGFAASPALAALANATAAHGLELDDTHDESITHPGAPVIAASLAMAQALGLGGRDVLPAIAAGYEVVGRIGAATGAAQVLERGNHPTALFCGFGVAAAAAKLLGLDHDGLIAAWGLQLSQAGGSMQFSIDAAGTAVKRLHGGYAAQGGVLAVELARRGLAGPGRAFDGRYGLCPLYGSSPQLDRLVKDGGAALEIHAISFKPYPCCRLFHSTLDALATVTDGFALPPDAVRRVVVGGPAVLATQHMLRRPKSEMAAQYSLPFTLGAAMVFGPEAIDGFAEAALSDARVLDFADRVEALTDEDFEAAFPRHFGSWVEIERADGERRRADVLDSLGTPARPMTEAALIRKYTMLCDALPGLPTGRALWDRVEAFARGGGAEELLDGFGPR